MGWWNRQSGLWSLFAPNLFPILHNFSTWSIELLNHWLLEFSSSVLFQLSVRHKILSTFQSDLSLVNFWAPLEFNIYLFVFDQCLGAQNFQLSNVIKSSNECYCVCFKCHILFECFVCTHCLTVLDCILLCLNYYECVSDTLKHLQLGP